MAPEQDQRITEVVKREHSRLLSFIRRRVPDPRDAEDILQEVFCELVEANRLLVPIDHVTGWLFLVASNRRPYSLGSTGSLSSARTPNTHSWTLRSGSRATNLSKASLPKANSRWVLHGSLRVNRDSTIRFQNPDHYVSDAAGNPPRRTCILPQVLWFYPPAGAKANSVVRCAFQSAAFVVIID